MTIGLCPFRGRAYPSRTLTLHESQPSGILRARTRCAIHRPRDQPAQCARNSLHCCCAGRSTTLKCGLGGKAPRCKSLSNAGSERWLRANRANPRLIAPPNTKNSWRSLRITTRNEGGRICHIVLAVHMLINWQHHSGTGAESWEPAHRPTETVQTRR